jgi:hypothetical protein
MTTALTPSTTRPLRHLLAAAATLATLGAQAVPVTVSVGGLPPGLAPVLGVQRNVCPDGMGWVHNPSQTLTETSITVFDTVTLPGGQTTIRPRTITRYVARFDTPATPATRTQPFEVRCSAVGISEDRFQFTLRIPGFDANDQPATALTSLGSALQGAPVAISQVLAARTVSFTPALSTLTRNVPVTVDASYSTPIGLVQGQRLDFLRPSALIPGLFSRVASLFLRSSDGAACVQSGSTTRCLSGATPVEAGGVTLRSLQRIGGSSAARFGFQLAPTFPIGTLKLRALADATDLPEYNVDGSPQALDLLPWAALEQTVTVQ